MLSLGDLLGESFDGVLEVFIGVFVGVRVGVLGVGFAGVDVAAPPDDAGGGGGDALLATCCPLALAAPWAPEIGMGPVEIALPGLAAGPGLAANWLPGSDPVVEPE